MTTYLHVHCGSHQLLVDATAVLAIDDAAASQDAQTDTSVRLWRGRQLPVFALDTLLGGTCAARHQVVLGNSESDAAACIVDVGQVTTLVDIDTRAFSALADYDQRLKRLVDGIHVPPAHLSKQVWLRLRLPLDKEFLDFTRMESTA